MPDRWAILPILVLPFLLAGCKEKFEWRQKMAVTVETPPDEKSMTNHSPVEEKAA